MHQSEKVCAATCKVSVCPSSIKSPVGVEPSALLYSKGVCLSFLAARGGRQCAVPCKVLCAVPCAVLSAVCHAPDLRDHPSSGPQSLVCSQSLAMSGRNIHYDQNTGNEK